MAPEGIRLTARQKLLEAEYIELDEKMSELAGIYVKEGALTKKSIDDARHVAIATIAGADAIVSWNFKHMVRIRRYDAINLRQGYGTIRIHTPVEIVEY